MNSSSHFPGNSSGHFISDKVTVLVFKDNDAARTFHVSLSWINRLGLLLGILVVSTLASGFFAIKFYRASRLSSTGRSLEYESIPKSMAIAPVGQTAPLAQPSLGLTAGGVAKDTEHPLASPATSNPASLPAGGTALQAPYQFSAFPTVSLSKPPPPSDLPFIVQTPKVTWKGQTLLVRFALQYVKDDQGTQQGKIVILARSPNSIHAYPDDLLNLPGKSTLISPERGEFFSVSRFREVRADFGPLSAGETISLIEILIFDTLGKTLTYQTITPPSPRNPMNHLNETTINIIAEGTRIEGQVLFDHVTRVHGVLVGEVHAKEGSNLILSETAVIEGNIDADTLIIDGYVRGDIMAKARVVISRTGRVIGNIQTASLILEFGAHFEGRCSMEKEKVGEKTPKLLNLTPELTPQSG